MVWVKKMFFMIFILLFISGCASYTTVSLSPSLEHPNAYYLERNEFKISALPVVSKEDAKRFFDRDDLCRKGFVPIYLSIYNFSNFPLNIHSLALKTPEGELLRQIDAAKAAESVKRETIGKAIGWLFLAGAVAAGISVAHTASVNEKIVQDLVNKQFKSFSIKPKDMQSGYLYFEISENIQTLDGFKLVLDIETDKRETLEIPLRGKITAKNQEEKKQD